MKLLCLCLAIISLSGSPWALPDAACNVANDLHPLLDRMATASQAEQYSIVRKLTHYPLEDFDPAAKTKIAAFLRADQVHLREWVLLAGFIGLKSNLANLMAQDGLSQTLQQTIRFAQVRCGDELQLRKLLRNVRSIPVDDAFVYKLVPLLVYTRQKEVVDYLLELIQRDDRGCMPADAETPGAISCAYRILEFLAPVITDFPLNLDASGDLDVEDYPQALRKVRQWILDRNGNYVLNRTTY